MAFEIVLGLYPEIIYDLIRAEFRARKSDATFFSANCCSEQFRVQEKKNNLIRVACAENVREKGHLFDIDAGFMKSRRGVT